MSSRENELHDEMVREINDYLAMRRRPHSTPLAGSSSPETTSREAPPHQPHHRGEGYYQWVVLLALVIAMVFLGYPGSILATTNSKPWACNTTLVKAAQHYNESLQFFNGHVNHVTNLQTMLEWFNDAATTMHSDAGLVYTHEVDNMCKHVSTQLIQTHAFLEHANATMSTLADSNISVGELMDTVAPLKILALDAHVEIHKRLRSIQSTIDLIHRQSRTPTLAVLEFVLQMLCHSLEDLQFLLEDGDKDLGLLVGKSK